MNPDSKLQSFTLISVGIVTLPSTSLSIPRIHMSIITIGFSIILLLF